MAEPAPLPKPEHWARLRRWLQPGIGVKRWLARCTPRPLTLVALGAGLLLTHLYRTAPFPEPVYYATLQFVPRAARGCCCSPGGPCWPWPPGSSAPPSWACCCPTSPTAGAPRALRAGGGPVGPAGALPGPPGGGHRGRDRALHPPAGAQGAHRQPHRGGHGVRRRGLLRAPARDLRVLPPGDFRQCIAALADADPLVTALFEHRFPRRPRRPRGRGPGAGAGAPGGGHGLAGHAFGNLYIARWRR